MTKLNFHFFGKGGRIYHLIKKIEQIKRQIILERKFKVGGKKHIGKHFYVIGINQGKEGLFSIVNQMLRHIEYAVTQNMIPVVNMRDFSSQFKKEGINAWEEFFEQPFNYRLDDVIGANKVTFSYDSHFPPKTFQRDISSLNNEELNRIREIYKKYIRLNREMEKYIEDNISTEFKNEERKIGCICRGTDYFTLVGLPKQPSAEMMIEKIKDCMKLHNIKKIYCATEDSKIYKKFKDAFGDNLILNNQQMYSNNNGKLLYDINIENNIDIYKLNREYFLSLYQVSKCNYFFGGMVSGTYSVILMDNNFVESHIFRLGHLTENDVKKLN